MSGKIMIQTNIDAPVETVWEKYSSPEDIVKWNNADPSWHTPKAENDLRVGGKFLSRMEAKDGSAGFDFEGVYDEVVENKLIKYTMTDGREVSVDFVSIGDKTDMSIIFDAEDENPVEFQKEGWQSILDNFKKYVEGLKN